MVELVLGIAAAAGASTLYSLGLALQALDAREAPADGDGAVDSRLPTADPRADARAARGRPARARRGPAGAAVLRPAHAQRAGRTLRAPCDGGDRHRRRRNRADGARAQHDAHVAEA